MLGQEPVYPLTIVEARAIGVMRMRDDKGIDDKIIAVNVRDPAVADYHDRTQLPQHVEREIKRWPAADSRAGPGRLAAPGE